MINVNSNFHLGSKDFLDSRQSVATLDALLALDTNIIPNGFECYVQDLDCKYKYHENYNEDSTGNWKLSNNENNGENENFKIYTKLSDLGLDSSVTTYRVYLTLKEGETCCLDTQEFSNKTQFPLDKQGFLKITKGNKEFSSEIILCYINRKTAKAEQLLYYGWITYDYEIKWESIFSRSSHNHYISASEISSNTSFSNVCPTMRPFTYLIDHTSNVPIGDTTNYPFSGALHIYKTGNTGIEFSAMVIGDNGKIAIANASSDSGDVQEYGIVKEWIVIGGQNNGYISLTQAEYDVLTEEEKLNGKEYRTTDTGHIYKNGVEYGKDVKLSELGLVTNAQNFKINLTKNNASWYGMFTFNFVYGTTPCEITVAITDKVYYTITKGQNLVSAITYTQDGANYTIGIDLTAKVYGTQVVDMPREFGTINSLTAEQFAGDTTAISKGQDYNELIYTSLSGNLAGITTVLDLINALLTEYSALNPKKPVRFISGEIAKTTLTDLPVTYGLLQVTVAGWDVIEVRLAHSANGFKTMYYGFVNRISGEESISSIDWKKVATTTITTLEELGLTSSATVDDVHNKLAVGQVAILSVQAFDNYQTLFPYSDSNDMYARLEIQKGESVAHSRIIWWRKDGSRFAIGNINSNNKLGGWFEYALKSYVDGKVVTPVIKAAAGSNINTVGTPSVTASTSGNETTFTFNNLKGATGTTPTIKAAAGSNINTVGTPSVTASTSGTTTTFTFNNLKGAKGATGATGATPLIHVNGMGGGERTMAELGTNEGIIAICTNVSGGSFFTSVTDGTVKCNGSAFTSSKQPTAGTSYVIVNSGSNTARIYCKNNGGSAWTIMGDVL